MSFAVPVLETERLRLRGRTVEDFAFFQDMWADPKVTQYITGEPLTEEQTWSKFLRMIGHWQAMGFGYWVVEEKTSQQLVGEVGFGEFRRAIKPLLMGMPEIGWVLASNVHGKGYASEATHAAVSWGDAFFDASKMSCIIEKGHESSIKVAQKCGFSVGDETNYQGAAVLLLYRDIQHTDS